MEKRWITFMSQHYLQLAWFLITFIEYGGSEHVKRKNLMELCNGGLLKTLLNFCKNLSLA